MRGVPGDRYSYRDQEERTHQVKDDHTTQGNTDYCLEAQDLAASKLAAHRDMDRDFVRILVLEKMIDAEILLYRIDLLPVAEDIKQPLISWKKATVKDF